MIQRRCAPLWSPQLRNNRLTLTGSPARCGLATISRNTSGNSDLPTDQWQAWQNWYGHLNYDFHSLNRTRNLGDGGGWARKTMHQSYHTRNSEKVSEKTTPTSNVIRHSKSSAIDLFLVPEDIVCNEGATQMGRGCSTSWVTKHEWAGGKYGGGLSGACVLGSTIR